MRVSFDINKHKQELQDAHQDSLPVNRLTHCHCLPSGITKMEGELDEGGEAHGEVEIYYDNGDYFWGVCVHGVREGPATVTLRNGDTLEGNFSNDLLEGFVVETLSCNEKNLRREVFYNSGVRHGYYRY